MKEVDREKDIQTKAEKKYIQKKKLKINRE